MGALVRGALAGAAGTLAMDAFRYRQYRDGGGEESFASRELGRTIDKWDDVSAPGKVGKRVAEGFLQRELSDDVARPTDVAVHWLYGIAWGSAYGIVAGSRNRSLGSALLLGPVVWLSGYVVLPKAGLYEPIWEYDPKTLGKDLAAHMVYGGVAAMAFAALTAGTRHRVSRCRRV